MRNFAANILRRGIGLGMLVVLLGAPLTACSNAVKTSNAAGLDDSIETLASGGVAVMEDVTSSTPIVGLTGTPSAMRFTRWQVRNLVAEANAHGGYLGSDLDALVAPPPGAPTLSVLVGAWLTRGDGALAQYAQRFMGAPDYKHSASVLFPSMVVLAFIADIARPSATAQAGPAAFDLGPWIAAPAQADGICTDVSNWVSTVVNNVTSAVQANGSGWLASLWNVVVSVAGTVFSIVVNGALQSIVGFVTEVATVVGTLTQVAAMFKPWTVQLAAGPGQLTLGPSPQGGAFDATLTAQDIPWPKTLLDCVSVLSHINLTDATYKDARITWSQPAGIPGLAVNDASDTKLRADKTAHYSYTTVTRPEVPADDCPVLVTAGSIGITVTVERTDVSKIIDSLVQLIANKLPPKLQSFLTDYEQPAINAAKEAVGNFKGPRASASAKLMEYIPDPVCQHTPPPGPTEGPHQISQLPFAPCEDIVSNSDVASTYSGDVVINNFKPPVAALFRNMAKAVALSADQVPNLPSAMKARGADLGQVLQNPQVGESTGCPIGPPYNPPPDPNDMGTVNVDAIFVTLPPDGTPVITSKSNPTCLAALAPELERFAAECWQMSVRQTANGPVNSTMLFVFTKTAKYVIEEMGADDRGTALMRTILQRYETGSPPTPPPTPTPPPPTPPPAPPPPHTPSP